MLMADSQMIEVRCPQCNKLLLRVAGMGSLVETKCDRCGAMVRYPKLAPEIFSTEKEET